MYFYISKPGLVCRLVQYNCEVLCIWSSGIKDCKLFTFENSSVYAPESSVVWQLSLPLMRNFNNTEAAIFPMQPMLTEAFSFFSEQLYFSELSSQ